jgi:DMSO/TMAO reductase YedYZ molybdopterin-dependent catalytic subunit
MNERWRWALGGAAAAALALAAGELVAGLLGGPSLIAAMATIVIDLQPPGAKDFIVSIFGTNDKLALEVATATVAILIGAVLGLLARRDIRIAFAGFGIFGAVAFFAAIQDPSADQLIAGLSALAAIGAGVAALMLLLPVRKEDGTVTGRRSVLLLGGLLVVGGVGTIVGRYLSVKTPTVTAPAVIPKPTSTLAPPAAGTSFDDIDGLSPLIVPAGEFYKIDTRLTIPHLAAEGWTVKVTGMVNNELELTYDQLAAMPLFEQWVTIACVSNEVGGNLVGNAKWTGVLLNSVLEKAGVQPGATQVVGRAFDGFTVGFPTDHLSGAGKNAMVALLMNGDLLPAAHGFPVRLIVPGLFGYVSATKWLSEIELTTWEAFNGYWVPLGWSKTGPILTQSRIDVPRNGSTITTGPTTVAGVAWAPTRGISKVEVAVDGAGWSPAQLSLPLADTTWIQWRTSVAVPAGTHRISVRATDGTGALQEEGPTRPPPDGARGWHTISVAAG